MGYLSRLGITALLVAACSAPSGSGPAMAQPDAPMEAPAHAGSGNKEKPGSPVAGPSDLTLQSVNQATFAPVSGETTPNPVIIKAEVLLDRADVSPGVIDGLLGDNFKKALAIFQARRGLPATGALTEDVWSALTQDSAPVLVSYTITPADVSGPFTPDIPTDYAKMAKLPRLGYRNEAEMFGERFHMGRALLDALNPGVDMTRAGSQIAVAQVARVQLPGAINYIDVDKSKGQVRAYAADGKLLVAYPASVGSEELPSPTGTHRVKGVARHPVYSYNPQKNFQQGHNTKPLTIPAGPNNPVGVVYIALSKPTYGIHGTPEPSKIDKTTSHGCVRLTNWDAQELAARVKPGVIVHFLGAKG